jgi:hypothetical protein
VDCAEAEGGDGDTEAPPPFGSFRLEREIDGRWPFASRKGIRRRSSVFFAILVALASGLTLVGSARATDDWQSSLYGTPTITTSSEGTVVDVAGAPGGIYHNASIDPQRTYTVALNGRQLAGQFTLVVYRDGVPTYSAAPSGLKTFRVAGTTRLSVLVYSDQDGSYRINALTLEDCVGCASYDPVIDPYGAPFVTSDDSGITITNQGSPGGLYYRAGLDPTKSYMVHLWGRLLAGSFQFVSYQDGNPTYGPAPNGEESLQIAGTSQLSLLLYSDQDGGYHVSRVTVSECPKCSPVQDLDQRLKDQILAETPALPAALAAGDTYTAAKLLLRWASPRTPWAVGTAAPLDTYLLDTNWIRAGDLYYTYLLSGQYGVLCGGTSDFLHKVLELFGIPSFTLDFGGDGMAHVALVVPIQTPAGSTEYRLLEPTFDADFTLASTGQPASVKDLLELWRTGQTQQIVVNAPSLDDRVVIRSGGSDTCRTVSLSDLLMSPAACGTTRYANINAATFALLGYSPGTDALFQLLATGNLFGVEARGVPLDFQEMQAAEKQQVLNEDAPQTTITQKVERTDSTTLSFNSSKTGSWFQCELDSSRWVKCDSPLRIPRLSAGTHTFEVRAISHNGVVDPTPAGAVWTIAASGSASAAK